MSEPTSSSGHSTQALAGFGPNEWLVDELYQQYLKDKNSVDRAWWDFFADYRPEQIATAAPPGDGDQRQTAGAATPTPAPR
ncbi:MAG: hypothetical protein H0U35_07585, partial [Sporichthyaceae bacterium]|nr:hypothetical protein [Sporichthyaceae bacterium]